jgi:acetylxylan esterase
MTRHRISLFVATSIVTHLFGAVRAEAASVTMVDRATWGANGVPDYVTMYVYVPDQLAESPPVLVACHSCGTPVSGYVNSISGIRAAADANGFIIVLPEATGRNCWDVGTAQSLFHDGGGDTQAIAQMVSYTLGQYDGDPSRVYVMGGSSGAMMTQALLAVYPDIFRAGSARAGVAAGCWSDGFDPSNQWSGNCANGTTTKSAQAWGDQVRAMYPGYTGHRPRVQLFHGTADTTIRYANFAESIKEWTNVLGLAETPTSSDETTTSVSTYARQFWENECGYTVLEAWAGQNGSHSMAYEENAILEFFGLDEEGGADPEPPCGGSSGAGGGGGTSSTGGASGAGAGGTSGGASAGGAAGNDGSSGTGTGAGAGGTTDSGGSAGSAGTGGVSGAGAGGPSGTGAAGGTAGAGGTNGPIGSSGGNGATAGSAGPSGAGGTSGTAGSGGAATSDGVPAEEGGCGCVVAGRERTHHASLSLLAAALSLLAFRRRKAA